MLKKINKLYKKNIRIVNDKKFVNDRSLKSTMFKKKIKYKTKNWDQMLFELKEFHEK